MKGVTLSILVGLMWVGMTSSANASIAGAVEQSAAELAEVRGFIDGDDENKAAAAMALLLDSDNAIFKQMAISYGLGHPRRYIRAAVLERIIRSSDVLQFEYVHNDGFTEAQKNMYDKTGGGRALRFYNPNSLSGFFPSRGNAGLREQMTVNGTSFHVHSKNCEGQFTLDGVYIMGTLSCDGVPLPARVKLY